MTRIEELEVQLQAVSADRDELSQTATALQELLNQPDPAARARIEELEVRLDAVAADRDALAQSVAELRERAEAPARA